LLDEGIRHDAADAALININDCTFAAKVARLINTSIESDWFRGVFQSADRCIRLGKNANRENVIETDFIEDEEKNMHQVYLKTNWQVEELLKKGELEMALRELAKLTAPLNYYFEKILVMHQDERIKANRLAFLRTLARMYQTIANFSKLAI
jgi:glycyl-tRNA synthetase beta chain